MGREVELEEDEGWEADHEEHTCPTSCEVAPAGLQDIYSPLQDMGNIGIGLGCRLAFGRGLCLLKIARDSNSCLFFVSSTGARYHGTAA